MEGATDESPWKTQPPQYQRRTDGPFLHRTFFVKNKFLSNTQPLDPPKKQLYEEIEEEKFMVITIKTIIF